MLKITTAQVNPTIGDFAGNFKIAKDAIDFAAMNNSDVVVFPELFICGYYPGDYLLDRKFIDECYNTLDQIKILTRDYADLHVILGMPTRTVGGPGKCLHNSLLVIKNGVILTIYNKQLLPTYDVFDELRHFRPGVARAAAVTIKGYKVGLLVCEDTWNDDRGLYFVNPYDQISAGDPDLVISIHASPSNLGKQKQRLDVIGTAAARHKLPILYVNAVGGQDSIVFDGASMAISGEGSLVCQWPSFQSGFGIVGFKQGEFKTFPGDIGNIEILDNKYEFLHEHLVRGIKDYARRCGFQKATLGLSGGLDSALVLVLAAEALGPENVTAVTMPSRYSSPGSVTDSMHICEALGVELYTFPIKNLVELTEGQYKTTFGESLIDVAHQNIQPRLRGLALMAYSNMNNALLLSTGNKSETSVGYCTLYGDTNGGLNPLGDIYKTEAYGLGHYINQRHDRSIIPPTTLIKPPSAELEPNQEDIDNLPPYPLLDQILKYVIEGDMLLPEEYAEASAVVKEIRETQVGEETYQNVVKMIARNEYKRRQSPPIIRVRPRAFGNGRQMPIAANTDWMYK